MDTDNLDGVVVQIEKRATGERDQGPSQCYGTVEIVTCQRSMAARPMCSAPYFNNFCLFLSLQIPGHHAEKHYYWLFPVCVPSPKDVVSYMNKHVRALVPTSDISCCQCGHY
jgi:hypothetical protein